MFEYKRTNNFNGKLTFLISNRVDKYLKDIFIFYYYYVSLQ